MRHAGKFSTTWRTSLKKAAGKLSKLKYHLHVSPSQITVKALGLHVNKLHDLSRPSPSSAGLKRNLPLRHATGLTDPGQKRNGRANGFEDETDLVFFPSGTLGGNCSQRICKQRMSVHAFMSAKPRRASGAGLDRKEELNDRPKSDFKLHLLNLRAFDGEEEVLLLTLVTQGLHQAPYDTMNLSGPGRVTLIS